MLSSGVQTENKLKNFSKNYFILFAFIGLFIILSFASKNFFTMSNIATVLRQASILAIVACGQYFVMIGGAFDLSVGATVGVTGIVYTGAIVFFGMNPILAFVAALITGGLVGLCNGLLVTKIGMPPFIATLALMLTAKGMTFLLTNATPISKLPKSIGWIGRGVIGDLKTFGVPVPVIIMFVVYIITYIVSEKTNFGRYIYAMGGNPEAAYLSGINIEKFKNITFILAGMLAAFASIILVARLDVGHPNSGTGFEFDSVTACVIGGVAITGGKGKCFGVLLGAIFLATLFNGMTLLNVNSFLQDVLKGVVLALAVGFDVMRNKKKD